MLVVVVVVTAAVADLTRAPAVEDATAVAIAVVICITTPSALMLPYKLMQ